MGKKKEEGTTMTMTMTMRVTMTMKRTMKMTVTLTTLTQAELSPVQESPSEVCEVSVTREIDSPVVVEMMVVVM
jgi:hypothetical protein